MKLSTILAGSGILVLLYAATRGRTGTVESVPYTPPAPGPTPIEPTPPEPAPPTPARPKPSPEARIPDGTKVMLEPAERISWDGSDNCTNLLQAQAYAYIITSAEWDPSDSSWVYSARAAQLTIPGAVGLGLTAHYGPYTTFRRGKIGAICPD